MKAFVLYVVLSVALAIGITGCAHERLRPTARTAATAAVVVGVIVLATMYTCADCNIGGDPNASRR